jgi:hypothetical protein
MNEVKNGLYATPKITKVLKMRIHDQTNHECSNAKNGFKILKHLLCARLQKDSGQR